jgi:hypothetical protein
MNLATARNLSTSETIRVLDAAWNRPLPEDVRGALISSLIESSDELIEAKCQIETLKIRLMAAHGAFEKVSAQLEQANAVLAKNDKGDKA